MFGHQKQTYFSRLVKSYPLLKLIDITDRQSFIREYVLDNAFVCVFAYILFYGAIWYASKIIKQIEKKNEEMLAAVEKNRAKLSSLMILKNKKTEYETVVLKAKEAQQKTSKELGAEMKRLNADLISTSRKLNELETLLEKMVFSTSFIKASPAEPPEKPRPWRAYRSKDARHRLINSRMLRLSNHRSPLQRHLRGGSVSLHDHQALHRSARYLLKSDSSNRASAETSSSDTSVKHPSRTLLRCNGRQDEDRNWYHVKRSSIRNVTAGRTSCINIRKVPVAPFKPTPFTRSVLDFAPIFLREE